MPLYHFSCSSCDNLIFEGVSFYDNETQCVEKVQCPQCDRPCGHIWLKPPGMRGDENISNEEKVAAALRLGFHSDGKLSLPSTRSQLRRIRESLGDFRVGEKELLTAESKAKRSEREREQQKGQTIEFLRERRAKLRAGEIPRATTTDAEVAQAAASTPLSPTRVLANSTKKGVL